MILIPGSALGRNKRLDSTALEHGGSSIAAPVLSLSALRLKES